MNIHNQISTGQICIGWDIGIKNLAYCIIEPYTSVNTLPLQQQQPQQPSIPQNYVSNGDNVLNEYINVNNTYYKIKYWRDINLVSQIESNLQNIGQISHINNTLKCSEIKITKSKIKNVLSTNTICNNMAIYCNEIINSDGTYKGYCKVHFKKSGIVKMPNINAKICYYMNCKSKTSQVLKLHIYTGYCKKHITEMIKNGIKQKTDFFAINRAKTTSKIDINQLGISLFQELDKIQVQILKPNIILLENQPVLKNPTMKSMQMFLFSYYLIRNMDNDIKNNLQNLNNNSNNNSSNNNNNNSSNNNNNNNNNNSNNNNNNNSSNNSNNISISNSNNVSRDVSSNISRDMSRYVYSDISNEIDIDIDNNLCIKKIQCYTASKKLDLINFFPESEKTRIHTLIDTVKNGYQKNKKMAIMIVEYLLQNNKKLLEFFNKHPKQDDLADSLLMTLHYFEKTNLDKLKKDKISLDNKT